MELLKSGMTGFGAGLQGSSCHVLCVLLPLESAAPSFTVLICKMRLLYVGPKDAQQGRGIAGGCLRTAGLFFIVAGASRLLPAASADSHFFSSSPMFVAICPFWFQSSQRVWSVGSGSSWWRLRFPDGRCCRASFHVLLSCLCIFCRERSSQILATPLPHTAC